VGDSRRYFENDQFYEIVFRAKEGIPLPCTEYMNTIIWGIIARTQRDSKVKICHATFLGNHCHMLVVSNKGEQELSDFHKEIKKKLTESIKSILDLERLELWDATSVMVILDLEMAVRRIAYCYNNPTKANLSETIEEYPGVTSWELYQSVENTCTARIETHCPWIRYVSMEPLGDQSAAAYTMQSRKFDLVDHTLVLEPNFWMSLFDINEPHEVEETNASILYLVRHGEAASKELRREQKKSVAARSKLTNQKPTVTGYKPEKKGGRVFFLGSIEKVNVEFWLKYKAFLKECRSLYQRWKQGDFTVKWPRHAFVPWAPPVKYST
jgi:REP element-mobilizing transposase RayT